ncbi:MAG: hypothetical protein CML03_09635 [Pseudooceanicola sp.]|nr:hypothetical protein [Pseudooceanicola sp.]
MVALEVGGSELGRIHLKNNELKLACHFTGFLEGILASGYLERGEVEPLIAECIEFVRYVSDGDADDIVQDFEINLLSHDLIQDTVLYRLRDIDRACQKSALNRFLGFCRGIVCDGVITSGEAETTLQMLDEAPGLRNVVGIRQIEISCRDALEDGVLTQDESLEICDAIGCVVGDCYGDTGLAQTMGVANFHEYQLGDLDSCFEGATVVLTGKFATFPRSNFEDLLQEYGAKIARHVSGKTTYLVIGGEASRDWVELNRGTKMRKAQEVRLKSEVPYFVSESQITRLMQEG